jgi:hypothetical protein
MLVEAAARRRAQRGLKVSACGGEFPSNGEFPNNEVPNIRLALFGFESTGPNSALRVVLDDSHKQGSSQFRGRFNCRPHDGRGAIAGNL